MALDVDESGRAGGKFSSVDRHIADEEEIELTSVGVDIGSSTSHLVFSRVKMERLGARYIVSQRETLHEAPIQLTPYAEENTIDAEKLGEFIEESFRSAGIERSAVDTGALILTGVAVRRRNARAIGDLFSAEAGKFVAVSAGDGLEATMAAHGSGAVIRSSQSDVLSGGTSSYNTQIRVVVEPCYRSAGRSRKMCRGAAAVCIGSRLALGPARRMVRRRSY